MTYVHTIVYEAMSSNVWGTFSVADHCRPNAFAAEALLFERLVIPVPADGAEVDRWKQPNPARSDETWDPERQQRLLRLLGTEKEKGIGDRALAFEVEWSAGKWHLERSRAEMAAGITHDASYRDDFYMTRMVLTKDHTLPNVVEAVASYPSEMAWQEDAADAVQTAPPTTAARALIRFARPFLTPPSAEDHDFTHLRAAIELANDSAFQRKRDAYYDFVRAFVGKLRAATLDEALLDSGSALLFEEQLRTLIEEERGLVVRSGQLKGWTYAEYALVTLAAVAGVAAPFVPIALAAGVAVGGSALGFMGWAASKFPEPREPRPLGGAAMFVAAGAAFGH